MSRKRAQVLFNINGEMSVVCKMRECRYYYCILIGLREIKNSGLIEHETLKPTCHWGQVFER